MGVMSGLAKDFIINKNSYKFQGNLVTLGEQTIFLLPNQVHEINGSDATKLKIELKDNLSGIKDDIKYISSDSFFKICGAQDVRSLDISSYQKAGVIFDLNKSKLPKNLYSSADFIFDGSTIEHIFNMKNVMNNLNNLLNENGYILHLSPLEGLAHDSFYQFGLCFFPELYKTNGYEVIFHKIFVYDYEHLIYDKNVVMKEGNDWFFDDLKEGLDFARKNNLPAQHLFLAKKHNTINTVFEIPYQGRYSNKPDWNLGLGD